MYEDIDYRGYGYIFYVYFHRNIETNEIFYVGIGSKDRANEHSNRSQYWKRYVAKYGKPVIEIYKSNLRWMEACHLEIKLISIFGRKKIEDNGILVNRTCGGEGTLGRVVLPYSDETRAKIGAGNRGKVVSEESRKKMSESKKALQFFAKSIINNSNGIIYKSVTQAAAENNMTLRQLSFLLRKGLISDNPPFSYINEKDKKGKRFLGRKKMTEATKLKMSKCKLENPYQAKIVVNNNTGEEYRTIKDAAKLNGVAFSTMWAYVNGIIKSTTNFSYKA